MKTYSSKNQLIKSRGGNLSRKKSITTERKDGKLTSGVLCETKVRIFVFSDNYLGFFCLRIGPVDRLEFLSSLPVVAGLGEFPLVVESAQDHGNKEEDGQADGQHDVGDDPGFVVVHGAFLVGASPKKKKKEG